MSSLELTFLAAMSRKRKLPIRRACDPALHSALVVSAADGGDHRAAGGVALIPGGVEANLSRGLRCRPVSFGEALLVAEAADEQQQKALRRSSSADKLSFGAALQVAECRASITGSAHVADDPMTPQPAPRQKQQSQLALPAPLDSVGSPAKEVRFCCGQEGSGLRGDVSSSPAMEFQVCRGQGSGRCSDTPSLPAEEAQVCRRRRQKSGPPVEQVQVRSGQKSGTPVVEVQVCHGQGSGFRSDVWSRHEQASTWKPDGSRMESSYSVEEDKLVSLRGNAEVKSKVMTRRRNKTSAPDGSYTQVEVQTVTEVRYT